MRHRAAAVLAVLVVGCAGSVAAEGLTRASAKASRMSVFRQQASLLDTRLARQYQNSARLTPKAKEGKTGDGIIPGYSGRYRGEYLTVARAAAVKHGIPEDLFLRLVQKESGWNPQAVSPKGATGLAQLMPDTAARLGVDPTDPVDNLYGGARYLRMMYDRFGSWRLALAAYNAGPGAVDDAGGVPNYAETLDYVAVILGS
jgi:soluble lytic murein transglycosylase-like protein